MVDITDHLKEEDWAGLKDRLARHPLPDSDSDIDLNMSELATVFGVSTNTVKSWLAQSVDPMPCVVKGANGREYVLRLSWCFAWRKHQETQKKNRDMGLARLQGTLFGDVQVVSDEALTPKQVREVSEARMKHAQAAKMLGTLTEIEGVYDLFAKVFEMFRNGAMGMSDRLERELSLTPAQARQVDRAMEELLGSLIESISDEVIGKDFEANLEMNQQLVNEA